MTGSCTDADRERFLAVCREVTAAPQGEYSGGEEGIGVLREKRMHAAIKRFVCADSSYHEQRPVTLSDAASDGDEKKRKKAKKYIADVLCGDEIYEIQTGSFWPLKEKLGWYAANTDCHVTVVHPIAIKRRIIWIDPASGEAVPSPRLARAGRVADVLPETVYISELVASGRVSLLVLLIEAEEYRWRNGWGRDGKRGSERFEMLPTALADTVSLELPEDFRELLPAELNDTGFTAAGFAKAMKLRSRRSYLALRALENLGVVRVAGKKDRARVYEII